MKNNLDEEISYTLDTLIKSGFFSEEEILEILEEQFIEEDIDFSQYEIKLNNQENSNFSNLNKAFEEINKRDIVAIHNCGYDIDEGVADAFELYIHLKNNKYNPIGFCFYTFEDIEEAIGFKTLKITFGDFQNNENEALKVGKIIYSVLEDFNFKINWNQSIEEQIELVSFNWDKSYNSSEEYEIEGAFEAFIKSH